MFNDMLAGKGSISVQIDCLDDHVSFDEIQLLESHLGDLILDLMRQGEMQED